jgi:hypothetical protein
MASENEVLKAKNETLEVKLNAFGEKLEEILTKQNEALAAERTAMEKADFEAFAFKLNAAARVKATEHYDGFRTKGWVYFEENPSILKNSSPAAKMNGVPTVEGSSKLEEVRSKLHARLAGKTVKA